MKSDPPLPEPAVPPSLTTSPVSAAARGGWYRCGGKRWLDILLAGTALVTLAPLMGLMAILVRSRLGAPAIFRQPRVGRQGRVFTVFKFRTMREAFDAQGRPLPDEQRLTTLGKKLRSLSLDELPQLWNILRGDMSIVGPRPLLVRYLPRYSPEQARRHDVRPGITGWAQINGRNSIDWSEKFRLDVWYVDHYSLATDLQILAATISRVWRRDGINNEQHATMPEFLGNAPSPSATDALANTPAAPAHETQPASTTH